MNPERSCMNVPLETQSAEEEQQQRMHEAQHEQQEQQCEQVYD